MRNLPVVFFVSMLSMQLFGQAKEPITTQEDKTFLRFMYEHCPLADILQIDRSESSYVELEYLCEGKIVEMGIRDDKVVFIERETDADEVPIEKITSTIEKRYPGGFLDEVSMLTVNDTSFLKVELIQEGIEHNLFFTTDGKNYKPRTSLSSDKWNMHSLEEIGVRGTKGYDLLSPDTIYELPPILREISGIASRDGQKLLCVQDELGVVFEYDLGSGKITRMHRFTDVGDFEDITLRGDQILVLRSDGNIFMIGNEGSVEEILVQLPTLNVEGLHYDPASKRTFLASKEAGITDAANTRVIYELDERGSAKPHLTIDLVDLNKEFNERYSSIGTGDLLFDPSAVAVHPITGLMYVLSAADRLIAVYDTDLKDVYPLPAEVFFKPEGLDFLQDGTLLISSEGDKKGFTLPSVMVFRYKQ